MIKLEIRCKDEVIINRDLFTNEPIPNIEDKITYKKLSSDKKEIKELIYRVIARELVYEDKTGDRESVYQKINKVILDVSQIGEK